MILFLSTVALAGPPATEPTQAVLRFVEGGDTRDVKALKSATHEDFRVVAQMPDGLSVMSRETYLGLIEGGKIGGTPRQADIAAVVHAGRFATVRGTLSSAAADFDCTWTLVLDGGSWRVLQDAVTFVPK